MCALLSNHTACRSLYIHVSSINFLILPDFLLKMVPVMLMCVLDVAWAALPGAGSILEPQMHKIELLGFLPGSSRFLRTQSKETLYPFVCLTYLKCPVVDDFLLFIYLFCCYQ
jgi:hypothetical protein